MARARSFPFIPRWGVWALELEPTSSSLPDTLSGSWIRHEAAAIQTGAMCSAVNIGESFTCYVTVPAPRTSFKLNKKMNEYTCEEQWLCFLIVCSKTNSTNQLSSSNEFVLLSNCYAFE